MSKALRLMDAVSGPNHSGDSRLVGLVDMEGCWRSCDKKNAGVPAIEVLLEGDKTTARVYGSTQSGLAGPEGWVDWGAVSTDALLSDGPGSAQAAGFVIDFPFENSRVQLQINFKIGVAVAGIFVQGRDTLGQRRALFWREFLARNGPITQAPRPLHGTDPQSLSHRLRSASASEYSTASLEGRWHNTNLGSRGIPELLIKRRGDTVVLQMWGRGAEGPSDWGEIVCETYGTIEEDNQESACVLATYSFDFMDCDVQVRQNKGILAVTTFNRFKDGSGRFDYVTRELYYREASA